MPSLTRVVGATIAMGALAAGTPLAVPPLRLWMKSWLMSSAAVSAACAARPASARRHAAPARTDVEHQGSHLPVSAQVGALRLTRASDGSTHAVSSLWAQQPLVLHLMRRTG